MDVSNSKPYRFLLGGYDLEMATIKQLLEENHCLLHDKHLAWGACLSAYADVFNDEEHFVGIELIEDIATPSLYTSIDHHNENSYRPSAIEQIAEMLDIKLNRYQQMVAANDRGFIAAMQAMGATKQEVDEIRLQDRRAQGVTLKDEEFAVRSIDEKLITQGNLIIVESLTSKFSTITDRLYPFEKLLISFDDHFVFYGNGVSELSKHFHKFIGQKKAYFGGGVQGFWGLAKGSFTKSEATEIKEEVINLVKAL